MLLLTDNTYIYRLERIEGVLCWAYVGRLHLDLRTTDSLVVAKISDDVLISRHNPFSEIFIDKLYPYQDGDY